MNTAKLVNCSQIVPNYPEIISISLNLVRFNLVHKSFIYSEIIWFLLWIGFVPGYLYLIFQMRVWVLKRRKLKNSLRFSFLLPVTRWFADRLMCTLVVCRSLYLELINLFSWFFFSWTFYYRCIFKYFANLYCYWSWFVIELHVLTGQDIVGDRLLTVTCFDNSMK